MTDTIHIHTKKIVSNVSHWTYLKSITSVAVSSTIMDVFGTLIFPQTAMFGGWSFLGGMVAILGFNFEYRNSQGCGKKMEVPRKVYSVDTLYVYSPRTHNKTKMNIILATELLLTCIVNVCARLMVDQKLKPGNFIMIVNSCICIMLFLGVIPWIMLGGRIDSRIHPLQPQSDKKIVVDSFHTDSWGGTIIGDLII